MKSSLWTLEVKESEEEEKKEYVEPIHLHKKMFRQLKGHSGLVRK